jgi:hypothetical protein
MYRQSAVLPIEMILVEYTHKETLPTIRVQLKFRIFLVHNSIPTRSKLWRILVVAIILDLGLSNSCPNNIPILQFYS